MWSVAKHSHESLLGSRQVCDHGLVDKLFLPAWKRRLKGGWAMAVFDADGSRLAISVSNVFSDKMVINCADVGLCGLKYSFLSKNAGPLYRKTKCNVPIHRVQIMDMWFYQISESFSTMASLKEQTFWMSRKYSIIHLDICLAAVFICGTQEL